MVQNRYFFDPYPLQVTMQRLAENLKARRLEKKISTKSLSEMSGVPASSIQRFELKHSISLESYVKLAKALAIRRTSCNCSPSQSTTRWRNCWRFKKTKPGSAAYDNGCTISKCDLSWQESRYTVYGQ